MPPVHSLLHDLALRARGLAPFALRVEWARLRRYPAWLVETPGIARARVRPADRSAFGFELARHTSPLRRAATVSDAVLQRGKEINVGLASRAIDGLVVAPYQVFSYHRIVGRPSLLRGFRHGPELHDGELTRGVGGGCCQVSNMLYVLALRAGMNIVERHRHTLDLYPDDARTVPFGCGATVFFNLADLRFENPLPVPVLLDFRVADGLLTGALRTHADPGFRASVYEVDHRFEREPGGSWVRENRIRRAIRTPGGEVLCDHEVAHNRARVCYEPADVVESIEPATDGKVPG